MAAGLIRSLVERLREKDIRGVSLDSEARITMHRKILKNKKMMRDAFSEFYTTFNEFDRSYFGDVPGARLEIGAGASALKEFYPDVISSDVVPNLHLDIVIDAMGTPFADNSIRSVCAINVFHHLPDPFEFFRELTRILHKGGGAILIEPYYGPLSRFVHTYLHSDEYFDMRGALRQNVAGPMSNANQAMSYIVFNRERKTFESQFPQLKIVRQTTVPNFLRYLISGGVNFRQLLPDSTIPIVRSVERMSSPIRHLVSLHHCIVIQKSQ